MFYLIGLGLGDAKDITVKGLETVRKCSRIYLEAYTSILTVGKEALVRKTHEEFYGCSIILADRDMVESQSDEILADADKVDVALLVVGDPFGATTHTDFVLRAKEKGIPYKVIHNASIMNACGCCGLQLYNFGETISIVFWTDSWRPDSFYQKIKENRQRGMHTLCLLGKKIYEPPRYMSASLAAEQLLEIIDNKHQLEEDLAMTEDTVCVGLARIGSDTEQILASTLQEMINVDLGGPLHSLIIPGNMHPLEKDMLKMFAIRITMDTSLTVSEDVTVPENVTVPEDVQVFPPDISLGLVSTDEFYEEAKEELVTGNEGTDGEDTVGEDTVGEDTVAVGDVRKVVIDSPETDDVVIDTPETDDVQDSRIIQTEDPETDNVALISSNKIESYLDSSSDSESDERIVELGDLSAEKNNLASESLLNGDGPLNDSSVGLSEACRAYSDFICSLCKQLFQDPRILSCLHTFCYSCLEKELKSNSTLEDDQGEDGTEDRVTCPSCGSKTMLTDKGLDGLPVNHYLQNMADISKSLDVNECGVCRLQNVSSPAQSFCLDCSDLLCEDCANKHTFTRFTLSHKVTPLKEDALKGQTEQLRLKQRGTCSEHANEPLKFYCQDCMIAVCRDCILLDHQNHSSVLLSTFTDGLKKELGILMIGLTDRMSSLQGKSRKKRKWTLDTAEEAEVNRIKQISQAIIASIQAQEEAAVKKLHEKFDILRNMYVTADDLATNIQDTMHMSQTFVDNAMYEEIFRLQPIFRQRISTLLNKEVLPKKSSSFKAPFAGINSNLLNSEHGLKDKIFTITMPDRKTPNRDKMFMAEMDKKASLRDIYKTSEEEIATATPMLGTTPELVPVPVPSDSDTSSREPPKDAVTKTKKSKNRRKKKESQPVEVAFSTPKQQQFSDLLGGYGASSSASGGPSGLSATASFMGLGGMPSYPVFSSPTIGPDGMPFYRGYNNIPVHLQQTKSQPSPQPKQPKQPKQPASKGPQPNNQAAKKQKALVSISPKWRLDTCVEGDVKQPFLTCVHPVLPKKVVVSDSNNNKVKMFNLEGNFLQYFDAASPTSVTYTGGLLVWNTGTNVVFQSIDQEKPFQRTLTFQKQDARHPVAWFPKKHCIVGNEDHVRFYEVSKEEEKVTRSENMSFTHEGRPLSQIISVRSDFHGNHVVITDWNLKAFVIVDVRKGKNQTVGAFNGDNPTGPWLPGGACFDNKGNVFAVDYTGNRLLHLDTSGALLQQWNTSPTIDKPWCVACSGPSHLLVTGNDQFVHVYDLAYK
ncbi:hypothetical protein FSP39_004138 [Pinctada imbricata]|uniref:diphthine methyl ester synthase n=1 Tax=Pinctada imbricata TaxID=66713 RepID=A0AA88XPU4_PINIB|nr:hypothetical protein FSP39_004138 [Pinctada imbricata]